MRADSALRFVHDLEMHGIKLGLEKIRLLLAELGSPERNYPCVLVGGTNGKGSVAAILSEALTRAGYRCGRYTSPHLVGMEERVCLNDQPIPPAALERGAARVRTAIERLLASGRFDAPCTFFEATTAIALDYFARSGVEVAVLEVGMGGRFDATNAVEPIVSAITNVELDHERYLGATRSAIAGEKVGIARRARPLVVGPTDAEPLAALRAGGARAGAVLSEAAGLVEAQRLEVDAPSAVRGNGEWVRLRSRRRSYGPLRLGLAGRHQIDNAITAVAALERLEEAGFTLGRAAIEAGMSGVRWPGRLEHLPGRPLVILDGAHNPAGARALASFLAERGCRELTLVFGAMQDKSIRPMAEALFPLARRVVLTRPPYRRSAQPTELREALADLHPSLEVADRSGRALEEALAITPADGAVCVCGSLYLIGSVLRHREIRARRRQRSPRTRPVAAAAV